MKFPEDVVMELGDGPSWSGVRFVGKKGSITATRGKSSSNPAGLIAEPVRNPKLELYRSPGRHRNWLDCIKDRRDPVRHAVKRSCKWQDVIRGNCGGNYGFRLRGIPCNQRSRC